MRRAALAILFVASGCQPHRPPPETTSYLGLPVSGSLSDARRAGFDDCFNFSAIDMRCRRHKVTIMGEGPFEAAVDLVGGDGSGGFEQLTIWHDRDQEGVYPITDRLEAQGWQQCMTQVDERGDQLIYTRRGSPVWISMDLSYWGKRRLRVLPNWNRRDLRCTPGSTRISGSFKDSPGGRHTTGEAPLKKGDPAEPPPSK